MSPALWLMVAAILCPVWCQSDSEEDIIIQPELYLGPVFDIEDLSNPFQQLGRRGCLPDNFSVGNGTVEAIQACSRAVEPIETQCGGRPRMGYYYQCIQNGIPVAGPNGFDAAAFLDLITSFSPDEEWQARAGHLALRCITSSDPGSCSGLSRGQQTVAVLACWKWMLTLDCDFCSAPESDWTASCRRGRFLAGSCRRGPAALLRGVTDQGGDGFSRWEECMETMRNESGVLELLPQVAAGAITEERCELLSSVAEKFVVCLMKEFTSPNCQGGGYGKVEMERLRRAAVSSTGGTQDALALLEVLDRCEDERDVRGFIACWTELEIYACATEQANVVGLRS